MWHPYSNSTFQNAEANGDAKKEACCPSHCFSFILSWSGFHFYCLRVSEWGHPAELCDNVQMRKVIVLCELWWGLHVEAPYEKKAAESCSRAELGLCASGIVWMKGSSTKDLQQTFWVCCISSPWQRLPELYQHTSGDGRQADLQAALPTARRRAALSWVGLWAPHTLPSSEALHKLGYNLPAEQAYCF